MIVRGLGRKSRQISGGSMQQREFWWTKYDWTVEMNVPDPCARAAMLADMFGDTEAERERYYDEILADIMNQRY
jgi:hypothetical protein